MRDDELMLRTTLLCAIPTLAGLLGGVILTIPGFYLGIRASNALTNEGVDFLPPLLGGVGFIIGAAVPAISCLACELGGLKLYRSHNSSYRQIEAELQPEQSEPENFPSKIESYLPRGISIHSFSVAMQQYLRTFQNKPTNSNLIATLPFNQQEKIRSQLIGEQCAITYEVPNIPVTINNIQIYDLRALLKHYLNTPSDKTPTDPYTRQQFTLRDLLPEKNIQQTIQTRIIEITNNPQDNAVPHPDENDCTPPAELTLHN